VCKDRFVTLATTLAEKTLILLGPQRETRVVRVTRVKYRVKGATQQKL
jgi:hypothetical protein